MDITYMHAALSRCCCRCCCCSVAPAKMSAINIMLQWVFHAILRRLINAAPISYPRLLPASPLQKTYTKALDKMQPGCALESWRTRPAPEIALKYWALSEGATWRDVVLAIRADEVRECGVVWCVVVACGMWWCGAVWRGAVWWSVVGC